MMHPMRVSDFHGSVRAPVIDNQVFDNIDAGDLFRERSKRQRQSSLFIEAGDLDDQLDGHRARSIMRATGPDKS